MWHFLSLLRAHSMCSVSVWKALKRYFSKSEAACQGNHGGSLAGAFDLICRNAVMLWHFRHHSSSGQRKPVLIWKTGSLHLLPSPRHHWWHLPEHLSARCKCNPQTLLLLVFLCFLFPSVFLLLLLLKLNVFVSNVGVWRLPSPPPIYETCGLNRFATNYTYFTSA